MLLLFLLCFFCFLYLAKKAIHFPVIKLQHLLLPLLLVLLLLSLVIFSQDVFQSARHGLTLWCYHVVPSLLPFFICLELLKRTNVFPVLGKLLEPIFRPLFHIPGTGAFAIVMGMCSGYPVGAKFAASLREEGHCTKIEGERLLAFTNTSGPLFIIGSVGVGMFFDATIGFLLLVTHILAALLVGLLFRFYGYQKAEASSPDSSSSRFHTKSTKGTSYRFTIGKGNGRSNPN